MSSTPHNQQTDPDDPRQSTQDTAGRRGSDERRQPVDPAQNPAPRSPEPDQEAIRKSEETLERVKPY
jgi:hypothetical protein